MWKTVVYDDGPVLAVAFEAVGDGLGVASAGVLVVGLERVEGGVCEHPGLIGCHAPMLRGYWWRSVGRGVRYGCG